MLEQPVVPSPAQPTLFRLIKPEKPRKLKSSDVDQQTFTDLVVNFVTSSYQPLSIVQEEGFRALMDFAAPQYTLPCRQTLSNTLLRSRQEAITKNLSAALVNSPAVTLTMDLWSNRQMRSYIGITGHFVQDWELQSALLTCKRFRGRHTAINIAKQYEDTVTQYGIKHKVQAVITDNAASIVKAFNLPGFTTSTISSEEQADEGSDFSDSEESEDSDSDSNSDSADEVDASAISLEHVRCFAHTFQLCLKDGFREAGPWNRVLIKVAKIVPLSASRPSPQTSLREKEDSSLLSSQDGTHS